MLLLEDIQRHGTKVHEEFVTEPEGARLREVVFASYPKTLSIFAVVATVHYPPSTSQLLGGKLGGNSSSVVYVSTATYGCVLDDGSDHEVTVGLKCDGFLNWIEVVSSILWYVKPN